MGHLGIRIANVALFTVCSFQVASVFNTLSADFLRPGPAALHAAPAPALQARREWAERQPILDRNLFDAQTFAAFVPEPEPEVEDLEATKLPLRLLGTQLHSVRENSKAVVTDRGARDHELVWEGDSFEKHPQAKVIRIERGRLIIDNQGRREELLLAEESNLPAPRPSRADRRQSRRAASRAAETPSLTDRLRQLQDRGGRDMGSILSQGRPVPKWEDGQLVGMELRDVEPGGLYDKVGLAEGDVITGVNGIQLDNAADASRVLAELTSAESLEIETTNGTISVDQGQLDELLGGDE